MSRSQSAPRIVHVSQNVETEVTFVAAPRASLRYAYFRSSDSVASQIEGQDYLAFKYDARRLVFAVCDGVGSSFCGNIAARVLGEAVLEWLWGLEADHLTRAEALAETAKSFLNKAQPVAQDEVARYQIADHLPPLIQQALEAQRAYGSETVFVAGRLDHPDAASPAGRLLLVWMGDSQIHLYDNTDNEIDIGAAFDVNDRWSSTQGVKGTVHSWVSDAEGVARLLAFSDGISSHADRLVAYSDIELEEASQAQYRTANSDDVALLDIVPHTPAYMGLAETERPVDAEMGAPQVALVEKDRRDSTYEVRWRWEGNKAKFELQEATNPAFRGAYLEQVGNNTTWQTEEPRAPGRYYYRVRAVIGRKGTLGPWSAPQIARVAYPPPEAPAIQPVGPTPVQGAFSLAWNEVANAQDYILEEARQENFSDAAPVYRGRGTDWHAGGGREPGRYYYRVQAVNDGGTSVWSESQLVAVVVPPPPVPTLAFMREVPPRTPFTLNWSDVAQATRYEVQEIDEAAGDEINHESRDARMTMDVHSAGRYTFRVRACHEHGCSEWSNAQTVEVLPDTPELAPELVIEGPDANGQVLLQWTGIDGAARYVLEESDKQAFKRTLPMNMGERTQHSLLRREPGLYYYRVRGENVSGFGPWSESVEAIVGPGTPAWIDVNLPDEEKPRVEVAWDTVAGQVTYELELVTGEADDPEIEEWPEARSAYKGREPASVVRVPKDVQTFAFRVRAVHASGEGDWQYSERISRKGPPGTTEFEDPIFQENGEVIVRWRPVEEATHYEIDRARDPSFEDARVYTTDRIRFRYQPQSSDAFWFRVRACNEQGCGEPSEPTQIAIGRIDAPRLLPVEAPAALDGSVTIVWAEVEGALQYEVQKAEDESFQNVVRHVVNAPEREWTLYTLTPRRTYLRVQAIGSDGRASEWSEVVVIDLGGSG
jgi:hypothetical protein